MRPGYPPEVVDLAVERGGLRARVARCRSRLRDGKAHGVARRTWLDRRRGRAGPEHDCGGPETDRRHGLRHVPRRQIRGCRPAGAGIRRAVLRDCVSLGRPQGRLAEGGFAPQVWRTACAPCLRRGLGRGIGRRPAGAPRSATTPRTRDRRCVEAAPHARCDRVGRFSAQRQRIRGVGLADERRPAQPGSAGRSRRFSMASKWRATSGLRRRRRTSSSLISARPRSGFNSIPSSATRSRKTIGESSSATAGRSARCSRRC